MKKRALISVSDKTGVIELASELSKLGYEIISTGGTSKTLSDAGINVINVSDITGFPECLDGRVKTLHPKIHGGILAMRSNPDHMRQIEELGVDPIDIVVINLYPFKETMLKTDVSFEECIENIDIGGPTMIRAAAKNYQDVSVIVDPSDYEVVLNELKEGGVTIDTKLRLAYKVFEHTAAYDTLISSYLRDKVVGLPQFSNQLSLTFELDSTMRYGENPHQKAAFYKEIGANSGSLPCAKQLWGKELSYNNIGDANGALEQIKEFTGPTVVAVKHANPCGVGIGDSIYEAYMRAYEADPVSIFGGIVALNREVDKNTAEEMAKIFLEIIIAPSFTAQALEILEQKKNIRLLELPQIAQPFPKSEYEMKKVAGGLLVQERNTENYNQADLKVVTKTQPTAQQWEALKFGWKVVKHTKSNAIVLTTNQATTGVGPGQTNRITAAELAIKYAGDKAANSIMASDAYFPFPDCVEAANAAGIKAIIQPGGSINDQKSIDACDKYGIAMVFTGIRHFKH